MTDEKPKNLSLEDIDDAEFVLWMHDQLTRVRDFLVHQNVDDEMISAMDQAILDNEQWLSIEVAATVLTSTTGSGSC
ncbi:hypothetical protein KUG85_05815 [Nitratireductor sp. L1-7-SE]|uniref:Uncharacterized protein n=1 Tax=Nitratireductor rhodophyticola TaxID=2854036 RepID=A0ABS7RAF5_9HYPH|nr:hypothetical protein [Nitratireductor rhodophyticola]MBY8917365.1 hypothetical protein [Nitratireductor rhodophyticola]MBY8920207.1 hypothetical protein [Nitratireductor rhodophyticola]